MIAPEQAAGRRPAPADVPGNDWTLLEPPDPAAAEPLPAAAVLEAGGEARDGELSAAALAAQDYPPERIVVIRPGEERQPAAELVVLLPPGGLASPGLLRAHARWHALCADAVSLGPAFAIAAEGLDPGAVAPGASAELLEPRREQADDPFELVCDLTRELTDPQHGLLAGAALGTMALRRETLEAAGGLAPPGLGSWAHRRLDLFARLWSYGALFVPEPAARAWAAGGHAASALGREVAEAAVEGRTLELAHPDLAGAVPLAPFRPVGSPLRFRRPAMAVTIEAGEEPADEVLAAIGPILGGRFGDFELIVRLAPGHPGRREIEAALAGDGRARLAEVEEAAGELPESPFTAWIPAVTWPDARTMQDLHRLLVSEGVGALHVTVPGAPPAEAMIEAVATGALARARRVAEATGEPAEVALGRLFGERWHSGVEVSARRHGVEEPHVTEHGPLSAATDIEHERVQHLRFRDRAASFEQQAEETERKVLAERLRVREERRRAEALSARLHRIRGDEPPAGPADRAGPG